jgi:hypothetical protein
MDPKKNVKLSELINWVKQEILAATPLKNDPAPLFAIDEVILEVKFTLSGEVGGDFNMLVVQADSNIKEERIQKATIRMKALIPPEELAAELKKNHRSNYDHIFRVSAAALLKGDEGEAGQIDIPIRVRNKRT